MVPPAAYTSPRRKFLSLEHDEEVSRPRLFLRTLVSHDLVLGSGGSDTLLSNQNLTFRWSWGQRRTGSCVTLKRLHLLKRVAIFMNNELC